MCIVLIYIYIRIYACMRAYVRTGTRRAYISFAPRANIACIIQGPGDWLQPSRGRLCISADEEKRADIGAPIASTMRSLHLYSSITTARKGVIIARRTRPVFEVFLGSATPPSLIYQLSRCDNTRPALSDSPHLCNPRRIRWMGTTALARSLAHLNLIARLVRIPRS